MNKVAVIEKLKELYPNANIVLDNENNPSEIVAEVNPKEGIAVAVIDKSVAHHHNKMTEEYKIIRGELDIFVDSNKHHLKENDIFIIKPGQVHYAVGDEAWVEVIATPPWSPEDHILDTLRE